jgi:hypothetical protein
VMAEQKKKFRPKRKVLDRSKMPILSKQDIIDAFQRLHECAEKADARYAVIGGSLFTMLEIDGYETRDIDVASDIYLDGFGIWSSPLALPRSTSKALGHYLVNGTCIDWMVEGQVGSYDLFQATLDNCHQVEGVWCANLEFALAIKLYAGRPTDKEVYDEFVDADLVNDKLVQDILKTYTIQFD